MLSYLPPPRTLLNLPFLDWNHIGSRNNSAYPIPRHGSRWRLALYRIRRNYRLSLPPSWPGCRGHAHKHRSRCRTHNFGSGPQLPSHIRRCLTLLPRCVPFPCSLIQSSSMIGALHWGMEFAGLGGFKGYPRLLLGVSPAVVAWSTITLQPTSALLCQWLGFTALWYADNKATAAGWSELFR